MEKAMANLILKFFRYLDARQPMTSKEVNDILNNKDLSEKFFKAIIESREKGEKIASFSDQGKEYTIELVKDLEPAL